MNQNPDLSSDHKSLDDQKMPCVKYSDLEMAMSFVSSGDMFDAAAHVSRKTGKIYWESSELDEEDDFWNVDANGDRINKKTSNINYIFKPKNDKTK